MAGFLDGACGWAGDDFAWETAEGGIELKVEDAVMPDLGVAGVISTLICGRGDLGDLRPAVAAATGAALGMSNAEFWVAFAL